ncbi:MAG: type II toxin-antitoxin system RelB/DinJ family antitoxin [Victivallales bacterium]|nr:type II toxin-antitoxin system RelB/DinJ family antitoxin [Victivallales bacterium]
MAVATFSVRMDAELKKELDKLCMQLGMNTSVAINIFARTVVRERRIPFEISIAPSDAGMRAFQSLRRQAKAKGLQDMPLSEINQEIEQSRTGK